MWLLDFSFGAPLARVVRPRLNVAGEREPHLAADDEVQIRLTGSHMGARHAGNLVLIRDGYCRKAERLRTLDELGRMRGAGQETEVAAAVEFGVAGVRGHEGSTRHG